MKWIPLKLSNVNELYNEYDQVCYNYNQLRINVKVSKAKKAVSELKALRDEIKQRIRELNDFYNKYINDSRIGAFEIIKNKLEMLLANKETPSAHLPQIPQMAKMMTMNNNPTQIEPNNKAHLITGESNKDKEKTYNVNDNDIDNDIDHDNDTEIFTCCNQLLSSQIKTNDHWKDIFIKIKLSEAEYNILFKDANSHSNKDT